MTMLYLEEFRVCSTSYRWFDPTGLLYVMGDARITSTLLRHIYKCSPFAEDRTFDRLLRSIFPEEPLEGIVEIHAAIKAGAEREDLAPCRGVPRCHLEVELMLWLGPAFTINLENEIVEIAPNQQEIIDELSYDDGQECMPRSG